MQLNDFGAEFNKSQEKKSDSLFSFNNTIAVYTVLSILIKMQHRLGLEAMLEYMEKYLCTIEKHNPQMKYAASLAINLISVEKIYKEATDCEKK